MSHSRAVLITSGATREPIDAVRFISNFSTGQTGAKLAELFAESGWKVTLLHGISAAWPASGDIERREFKDFSDLASQLKSLLAERGYSLVLHLAAVSDFSVASVEMGGEAYSPAKLKKIDSTHAVTLRLHRNPKLVDQIKTFAGSPSGAAGPRVAAFKLTNQASAIEREQAVERLASSPSVDWVIHNDLSEIRSTDDHPFTIYRHGEKVARVSSVSELAQALLKQTSQEAPR